MATSYTSSVSASKDSSNKDKDSTDTYVRSGESSSDKTTIGKNKTLETDKTHQDSDVQGSGKSGHQYGLTSGGQSSSQQRSYGQQDGDQQQFSSSRGSQSISQQDVQQKLREVGNLLQKAGSLLQDLQGSAGDIQTSSLSRGPGGNYSGPFGGFEAQQYGPSSQYGQYGGVQHLGGQQHFGRSYESDRPQFGRDSDREERFSGRSNFPSSLPSSRFDESRQDRSNVDRFGGFGGPNRPDLAYGQQYGGHGSYGSEGRRGGDFEFTSGRRNMERW